MASTPGYFVGHQGSCIFRYSLTQYNSLVVDIMKHPNRENKTGVLRILDMKTGRRIRLSLGQLQVLTYYLRRDYRDVECNSFGFVPLVVISAVVNVDGYSFKLIPISLVKLDILQERKGKGIVK